MNIRVSKGDIKNKMKKRIRAVFLICVIAMLCIGSVFTLSGCDKNDEPRDVELEVINPNTGEVLKSGDHIRFPGENILIEVRIREKKTGNILTDDDFTDNTVRGCLTFRIRRQNSNGKFENLNGVSRDGIWPQNEPYKDNCYHLSISFDCKPKNLQQSNYQRKYNMLDTSIGRFYID